MQVLSINSHVCYGHVGAQASLLPLQRLGHDVHHVPTVLLSNHPGYGGLGGGPVKLIRFDDLIDNMIARGFVDHCAALHTGYLGQAGTEAGVLRVLARLRAQRPEALYLCDPVIGDNERIYVPAEVATAIRTRLLPVADVVTPNRFELELLTDQTVDSLETAIAACHRLRQLGPDKVVCTGAATVDGSLTMLALDASGVYVVTVPYLAGAPVGTGDAFAATLLARLLLDCPFPDAVALAAATVHGLIRHSLDAGTGELAVVAGQEEIVNPSTRLSVSRLDAAQAV